MAEISPGKAVTRRVFPLRIVLTGLLALALASFSACASSTSGDPAGPEAPAVGGDEAPGPVVGGHPAPPPTGDELWAVDASSPDDVWAVGARFSGDTYRDRSLILHGDGTRWSLVSSPDVGRLTDVAAVSEDEAWAVGAGKILHWDGATWELSPHPSPPGTYFAAVDASGPNDVWAVGMRYGAEWVDQYGDRNVGFDTLTMHWDGAAWRVVPSPNGAPRHNFVHGVVALSPIDAWVVGYSEEHGLSRTLTLHWDGAAWSVVPSPNPGEDFNVLWGMGTDGAGGVWAVGHYGDPHSRFIALYLQWTGETWEVVPAPPGEALHQTPTSAAGASANDVWAVGSEPTSSFLIARWDGAAWSVVDAEVPGEDAPSEPGLADVVALSPADAWAVGRYQGPVNEKGGAEVFPLIEHWDGTAWRMIEAQA